MSLFSKSFILVTETCKNDSIVIYGTHPSSLPMLFVYCLLVMWGGKNMCVCSYIDIDIYLEKLKL